MDFAFTYAETDKLETEAAYPYTGSDGKCSYVTTDGVVGTTSFVDVPANNTA